MPREGQVEYTPDRYRYTGTGRKEVAQKQELVSPKGATFETRAINYPSINEPYEQSGVSAFSCTHASSSNSPASQGAPLPR